MMLRFDADMQHRMFYGQPGIPSIINMVDKYMLLERAMVLYSSKVITSEKYISINKMIMSNDDENYYVAKEIITNLEPKKQEVEEPF